MLLRLDSKPTDMIMIMIKQMMVMMMVMMMIMVMTMMMIKADGGGVVMLVRKLGPDHSERARSSSL